jgi:RNA polymerase sigma factor (TIGR02999 family)
VLQWRTPVTFGHRIIFDRNATAPVTQSADNQVSQLLAAASNGDARALEQLLPIVYSELHALAHRQRMRGQAPATMNTTALVHEAYIKLHRAGGGYSDRTHFFRVAAQAMRQILVDGARRRRAEKRGGDARPATFEDAFFADAGRSEEVLALDAALVRLAELSPRQARVVEMRYFAGFTIPETAELLECSTATVWRDWAAAQAWLQLELGPSPLADVGRGET